ncbi:hypothetical protein C8T65DRAFT_698010 [Cerioporus squamosus]|nr:hypothetical protein C8T65DRAFT_698010 [Cerioporus squamosus]
MSSDADAATVALFDTLYTDTYCGVAAGVLLIYDTFVTLDREVACFWTLERIGASLLFFASKWLPLAYYVMELVSFTSFPSDQSSGYRVTPINIHSCSLFNMVTQAMEILLFFPGAAPVGANVVPFGYQFSGENFPPFGCLTIDNTTVAINIRLTITSRVPLIAADILLIYITWTQLSRREALRHIQRSKRLSLSDILFRDVISQWLTKYSFCDMYRNHIFCLVGIAGNARSLGLHIHSITTIIVSRFLLDLQEASQIVVRLDPDDPLHSSRNPYDTPSFISSLGGFINPELSARSDDDDGFELPVGSRSEAREDSDGGAAISQQAAASSSAA